MIRHQCGNITVGTVCDCTLCRTGGCDCKLFKRLSPERVPKAMSLMWICIWMLAAVGGFFAAFLFSLL